MGFKDTDVFCDNFLEFLDSGLW